MTKKEMFNEIIVLAQGNILTHTTPQEIIDFANHEIELLERKSSKSGMTKTQKENELLMAQIVEAFSEIENPVTITEFMKIWSRLWRKRNLTSPSRGKRNNPLPTPQGVRGVRLPAWGISCP